MSHWRYAFDCRTCANMQRVRDEIRNGMYCIPTMNGKEIMHADDDRTVRCDRYEPRMIQTDLWEGQ